MQMNESKIILRAVEIKDIDLIYKYENDIDAWTGGINSRFCSEYAIEQYVLSSQNESAFSQQQIRLMIDVDVSGTLQTVGCVDLYDIDVRNSKAGVGIYIDKAFRRRNYASNAVMELTNYAFNILNLHQLYAFVGKDNIYSNNVFEKCGFFKTAALTDWLKSGNDYTDVNVFQKIN